MINNLVFLLEDDENQRKLFELRLNDVGCKVNICSNVSEAITQFNQSGDVYTAYFLDMKVPHDIKRDPTYDGGLAFRRFLIENQVDQNKIYLMSAGVSHNDELAAKEYGVSASQIIAKECFTEKTLRELLI